MRDLGAKTSGRAAVATAPCDPDLAYLAEGTDEFWAYVRALRWAQQLALLNREEMMDRTVAAVAAFTGEDVTEAERINCHHNFTGKEHHAPARQRQRRLTLAATRGQGPPLYLREPGNLSHVQPGD